MTFDNPQPRNQQPRLRRWLTAGFAALGLATVALAPAPADARVFFSFGYPVGWGYYAPPPPPAYYYYPPAPVAYGPCGYGWRWIPGHWDRWGRWVRPHCG